MNSEQPVPPPSGAPTQPAIADEANPIAAALLARTRWMQRALTPWTQRWLSQSAASTGERPSGVAGRRDLAMALTVGAAEQTLSRVQTQYKSSISHPVSGGTRALPLAGALPQPVAAAESGEASVAVPPMAEDVKPAAPRAAGPYSRPFNSVEEFLKAVEAAKARNYEPPPPEEIIQPPPPREAGPYSHAFTSLAEFVKAVEESRQKSGYTPPPEEAPKPTPPPRGRIRPMSRVEELPASGSSFQSDIPMSDATRSSMPQTEPQLDESFSMPDRLPATPAAAETSPSDWAAPAPAQPAVIPPFSPVKARGGPVPKASGPQPASRQSATASESSQVVEPSTTSPTSPVMPLRDTTIDTTQSISEIGLPLESRSAAEFHTPIAPEALSADASITARPVTETAPTRSSRPSQQPTNAPTSPAVHSAATPAAPNVTSSAPAISSTPAIQRAVKEIVQDTSTPSEVESAPASPVTRLTAEPVALPDVHAAPQPMAPAASQELTVQRQTSELPTATAAPEIAQENTAALPVTPARIDMPLVQRETVETKPTAVAPQVSSGDEDIAPAQPQSDSALSQPVAPAVQRQTSEPPTATAAPEIARENVAVSSVTPARIDMPLVQRETAETKPTSVAPQVPSGDERVAPVRPQPDSALNQPVSPVVQRQTSEPPTATATPEVPRENIAVPSVTPARIDMPPVQRETAETKPTVAAPQDASGDDRVAPAQPHPDSALSQPVLPMVQRQAAEQPTATSPQRVASDDETAASSPVQTVPGEPVVQRQTSERSTSMRAPESTTNEIAALPVRPGEAAPARSDLPLVQRQTAEKKSTTTAPRPVSSAAEVATPSQIPAVPNQPEVQRLVNEPPLSAVVPEITGEEAAAQPVMPAASTPARSDLPLVQRQAAEQPTATSPQRVASDDKSTASSPVQTVPGEPVVQRQTSERSTSTKAPEPTAKEIAALPVRPGEDAPARGDLPLVQRQTAEKKSITTAPQPVTSAAEVAAPSQIPTVPNQPGVQRQVNELPVVGLETASGEFAAQPVIPVDSAPARSDLPLVQRQVAEHKPTAKASQPPTSDDKSVGSSQTQTASSQPMVQRRVSEPSILSGEPEAAAIRSERGTPPVQAVQRQPTEADSALPEVPAISTPARVDMPLVQRHAVEAQPIEDEPPPLPASPASISERIMARVASHETVPAARLPALPLHQPVVQRAPEIIAAPQPVTSQSVAATPAMSAPAMSAPLRAPVIQRMPEPAIQRMPAEPAAPSSGSGLIQRVETVPAESSAAPVPMDLDVLARQVYPIIKHLLAVERDRRTSR